MPGYVLDTSALMALVLDEPGAMEVLSILGSRLGGEVHERADDEPEPPPVYLPFVALMELEYRVTQLYGLYEAERRSAMIRHWPVELVESGPRWRLHAGRIKAKHRLSLADAWIAALAILNSARLVHRDPEFDAIEGLRSLRLPEK
jgi:predicted nucleic acid-binding protein